MSYDDLVVKFVLQYGAEQSTMMSTPCLRYGGEFMAMMFDKEDALIVKVPEARVNELVAQKQGREFNFTKKRFKEWVLIPKEKADEYEGYLLEALDFAKGKNNKER